MNKKIQKLNEEIKETEKIRDDIRRERNKLYSEVDKNTKLDDKLWYKVCRKRAEIEKEELRLGLGIKVSIELRSDKEKDMCYSCSTLDDALSFIRAKSSFCKTKGKKIDNINITINPKYEYQSQSRD